MREDPIISAAWIKAALVVLVAGALGVGAYLLASGVDINLPDINLDTNSTTTSLEDTTLEDTTIGQPEPTTTAKPPKQSPTTPAPPVSPSIQQLQELNRCISSAGGDIDKVTACFDKFAQ
jgi:hypothetical protein